MRRLFGLLALLLALPVMGGVWYVLTPMHTGATYPLDFSVHQGTSLKMAIRDMEAAGALRHPRLFELLARMMGKAQAIKAGSYGLPEAVTPLALLRKITVGETVLGKVTVIEGWTFADMRRALDAQADLRHDSAGMSDAELMRAIGADADRPEGRFFPDTFFFDRGSSDLALYRRAYHTMQTALRDAWSQRVPNLPYTSPEQALIMASIIEKETGVADERTLIAAVFVNRLRIGMRLQADPTVIYGLGSRFDGNLRRVDLEADTPYNTYTRAGLPPTPIALPGADALHAALNPANSRALYFVASGDGRHVFSTSLDEHNRAVARYQRRK
ncbi:MAG TPA: endolytic transglycosylase MltG [Thiobacillaceae bacterium]|nr:endolytic transglycosylase MltG [Thiobacillaceae bacterium]HNU63576.1 endolytic transglycosylase MltG [Thiobacillaceae bacterium]